MTIEGISIRGIRNILNQFADDMDVFSLCKKESIVAIFDELNGFRTQSGFTVSYDKTTLYRIGSLRHSSAEMFNLKEYAWSNNDITVLGVTIAHEDIVAKNYDTISNKVKKILQAWYNRGLTLIGKVQVVNTLIASLFVYKMMVLPQIPTSIVKNIDNVIRDFLWNGKKAKIAYSILQNPKEAGGLKLVNLHKKDIALKTTWPKILAREKDYSTIVYNIMRCNIIGEDIWRCRLKVEDVKNMKGIDNFWRDVLQSWSEINPYREFRIENQYIWYNTDIKVHGKPVMWNDVYLRGLKYVYQLFENGKFISDKKIFEEYGLTRLRFNSLKVAIPLEWKIFFKETLRIEYMPIPPHNYDHAIGPYSKGWSSMVYNYLLDDVLLIHNKYMGWRKELGQEFDCALVDYGLLHAKIHKITNTPKFRSFQYRMLQRGIVTNVHLYKWNIKPSNLCTFCSEHEETLLHLFVTCEHVQRLWVKVFEFIREEYHLAQLEINNTNIILSQIGPTVGSIANFICLITKQFIYSQRCLGNSIHFPILRRYIINIQNVEKYVAIKNDRLQYHNKKWRVHHSDRGNIDEFIAEYFM